MTPEQLRVWRIQQIEALMSEPFRWNMLSAAAQKDFKAELATLQQNPPEADAWLAKVLANYTLGK